MVGDGFTLFSKIASRGLEQEQFIRQPDCLPASLLLICWPLCKTFKVALVGAHEPRCAVTKDLGRDIIQKRGKFIAFKLGVLLVYRCLDARESEGMIAKCPEIAVFADLRVINKALATHPLRQYLLLFFFAWLLSFALLPLIAKALPGARLKPANRSLLTNMISGKVVYPNLKRMHSQPWRKCQWYIGTN